jgi:hypothetical protein
MLIYAFLLAVSAGIVSGGVTGSAWTLATGVKPGVYLLTERSLATPLKVAVLVFHVPLILASRGWSMLGARPVLALLVLALACLWSFLQGVFILTQIFGVT